MPASAADRARRLPGVRLACRDGGHQPAAALDHLQREAGSPGLARAPRPRVQHLQAVRSVMRSVAQERRQRADCSRPRCAAAGAARTRASEGCRAAHGRRSYGNGQEGEMGERETAGRDGGAGARPGHLAHGRAGRGPARGGGCAAPRPRSRHDADRHGGDVRGGGAEEVVGRGDRRRRDEAFIVSKVLPAQRRRRGAGGGLRAQPPAAPGRHDRPLPLALARQHPLSRIRSRASNGCGGGEDSTLGRIEPGCGRPGGTRRGRCRTAQPTRCSTTWRTAASSTTCCRSAGNGACRSWPIRPSGQGGAWLLATPRAAPVAARHAGATPAQVAIAWTLARPG